MNNRVVGLVPERNDKVNYKDWSKDKLSTQIQQLRKRKKYGTVWEDKSEGIVKQCRNELPVLEAVRAKEIVINTKQPANILIEGDNYHDFSN